METNNLILVEHFCTNCDVEFSFINSLNDQGIIELIVQENKNYLPIEQIKVVERAMRFYYELNINMEGIDVISNLLTQINDLQQELRITRNKLMLFDFE